MKADGQKWDTGTWLRLGRHPSSILWGLTLLGLGLLNPPDGLGDLKVVVRRQGLDGSLQLRVVQDLRGDLIGQSTPRDAT